MKLLYLELQAFGSFKNKETIDFTLFDSSKIFLISGKTGSGKTTIFDSISYALFGKLTGQFKTDDTIRSHYASDNDETYVKLRFKEQDTIYEVYRKPSYKISTRKTPTTLCATLTSITDDKVLSSKANITNKLIEDILKFNHEQFKQIVVLPQGEFIKILNSNSNDKEKLLSSLLNTSIYSKITDKLREENYSLETKLSNVKAINENTLNKYNIKTLEELSQLLEENKGKYTKINNDYKNINEEISSLKLNIQHYTNLNNLKIENEKLKDKLNILTNDKEYIDSLRFEINIMDKVKELKLYQEKLKTYNGLLAKELEESMKEKAKFEVIKLNYKNIEDYNKKLEIKKARLSELSKKLIDINNLEKDQDTIESLKYSNKNYNIKIDLINKDICDLNKINYEQLINDIDKEYQLNKDYITSFDHLKLVNLQKHYEEYNINIEKYNNYTHILTENDQIVILINNLNQEVVKLETLLQEVKSIKNHNILENFIDLVIDNKPCPLCGSLEHPNVIQRINKSVTDNDILTIEDNILKLKLKLNNQSIKIENNNKIINEYKTSINYELLNLDIALLVSEINNAKDEQDKYSKTLKNINLLDIKKKELLNKSANNTTLITNKLNEITILNERISSNLNQISKLQSNIDNFRQDKELINLKNDYLNEYSVIENEINALSKEINTITNDYNNINKNIERINKSINEYNKIIEELSTFIYSYMNTNNLNTELYNNYLNKLDNYDKLYNRIYNYDLEYHKITSLINQNEDKIKDYTLVDIDSLNNNLVILEDKFNIIKIQYDEILEYYSSITNDYNMLVKLNNSNKEIIKRYEIINELFRLSNGTYSKVSKITLQKYVLGIILDKIIMYANYYLKSFTSNRYQLKRIIDESSSNRGLDLAVIDAQTGLERSVGSLSGGESFMCALSLAIGMSEGISNMSGGIRLDNIFIDEGFGSLDNEALDNAIEALMILASNGRMIGIISHVSDIKSRISNVIEVVKSKNGSKIMA